MPTTTGTTTINFGAKETTAKTTVSSAGITGASLVEAWLFPAVTASNTVDNHWVDDIKVMAGNVQNGVGFDVYALCNTGLAHGIYNVGWVYT